MGKEQLGNSKLVLRFEPLIVQKCNYMIERDNQKKIRVIQQEVGSFVLKNAKELINIHKID